MRSDQGKYFHAKEGHDAGKIVRSLTVSAESLLTVCLSIYLGPFTHRPSVPPWTTQGRQTTQAPVCKTDEQSVDLVIGKITGRALNAGCRSHPFSTGACSPRVSVRHPAVQADTR